MTLGAGGIALSALYQRSVMTTLDRDLSAVVDTMLANIDMHSGPVRLLQAPNDPRFARVFSGRYFTAGHLETVDGAVALTAESRSRSLWDAEIDLSHDTLERLASQPGRTVFAQGEGPDGEPLRVAAQAVRLPDQPTLVAVIAAADRRPAEREVDRFAATLWAALLALGAGLVLAVWIQVRVGLAPLDSLRGDLIEVRRGRSARLDGDYPPEVAPLTEEVNALLDHNRSVVERARTHVGNLAHALKTPISVLLNEARAADGQLAVLVARQAEGMARNVDHYLQRAQAAARAETLGARTPARPVLEDLTRTLERLYGRDRDLDLTVEGDAGLLFRGERQDLEEMAGNLLENACKYGHGTVRAMVRKGEARCALELVVEDDGPGVSAERVSDVLKRGQRLDETAPGQGLGLSIVADLARLYGGDLALDRSPLGGLRATLRLPLAD